MACEAKKYAKTAAANRDTTYPVNETALFPRSGNFGIVYQAVNIAPLIFRIT